ncbi:Putative ammonia monooxygenase [Corynebacterium pseudopelargi]|uniref:Ammonia monooxygenase n=2 Tax=Corynebacterium pseudopelargi TaxID=2080757 RepID=A0A3G6IUB2_9CORY|nr:Putative ammonia monooxygenase [Corynebacterium pseudopelargi]
MPTRFHMPDANLAFRWAIVVPASIALGWVLQHYHVPAAWILGGIVVSAAMALSTAKELVMNKHLFSFGRGFIGILAALPLLASNPATLSAYILPGILITIITLGIGVIGGVLLARSQAAISTQTGILSMLAGGASIMPLLAREFGADFRYVALSQYLRLLAVSLSLPLVAHWLLTSGQHAPDNATQAHLDQPWWALLAVILIAAFGEGIGRKLHIPVPSVLGPLLLMLLVGTLAPPADFTPPEAVRTFAFLSIGWMCGGSLSVASLKSFARQLPATLVFIVVLLLGCAVSAWPLMQFLHISYFEAYLATSPGALETVLALSDEGGAGPVVVAIQIIRLLGVLLIASALPYLRKRHKGAR